MSVATVRDAMTRGVVSCAPELCLREAARLMTDSNVRALIVIDGACGLAGIVSQTDLVNATLQHPTTPDWQMLPVHQVMTREVLTVHPDESLARAAKRMVDGNVHRLVVVDDSDAECKPIGVISVGDIMRRLAKE